MFKLALNNEIFKLPGRPTNYDDLLKLTHSRFADRLPQAFEFTYQDLDGDNITVSNELDYQNAMQFFDSDKITAIKFTIRPREPANEAMTAGGFFESVIVPHVPETKKEEEPAQIVPEQQAQKQEPAPEQPKKETGEAEVLETTELHERIGERKSIQPVEQDVIEKLFEPGKKVSPNKLFVPMSDSAVVKTFPCFGCVNVKNDALKKTCIYCNGTQNVSEFSTLPASLGQLETYVRGLFDTWSKDRLQLQQQEKPKVVEKVPEKKQPENIEENKLPEQPKTAISVPQPAGVNDSMMNSTMIRKSKILCAQQWKCSKCGQPAVPNAPRYSCVICEGFDLCVGCELKLEGSHEHPLIKLYKPVTLPLEIEVRTAENPAAPILPEVNQSERVKPAKLNTKKKGMYKAQLGECEPNSMKCPPKSVQQVMISLKNVSEFDWATDDVSLLCIEGFKKDTKYPLRYEVPQQESYTFILEFEAPEKLGQYDLRFQLYSDNESKNFGPKCGSVIIVENQVAKETGAISYRNIDRKGKDNDPIIVVKSPHKDKEVEKIADQFSQILGGKKEDYYRFIDGWKLPRQIDEMINEYLQQKDKEKDEMVGFPSQPFNSPQFQVREQQQQQQMYPPQHHKSAFSNNNRYGW